MPRRPSRPNSQILLADDNAVNQQVALALLAKMGYRADVVVNGEEVLDALARERYDVVLMDVEMPVMDGLEASSRINQQWLAERPRRSSRMTASAIRAIAKPVSHGAGSGRFVGSRFEGPGSGGARPVEVSAPRQQVAHRERVVVDLKTVDLTQLEATVGDPTFVRELISTFLSDAPHLVVPCEAFARATQSRGVSRIAAPHVEVERMDIRRNRAASLSRARLSAQTGTLASAGRLVHCGSRLGYARVEGELGALAGKELTWDR